METNKFFDINHFPSDEGILLFGISMNRIGNLQSPAKNFEYIQHLDKKIIRTEGIGLVTLFSELLYFNSEKSAFDLKNNFINLMMNYRQNFLSIISKDTSWIKKAFSFITFGQVVLDNSDIYKYCLQTTMDLYKTNHIFKRCIDFDVKSTKKAEQEEMARLFILEEITLFYLFAKGKVRLNNEFVKHPKWLLQCYPGKPLMSEVYLFQMNPLNLENRDNKYENCFYDLEAKILYDYTKIDINNFDF